MNTPKDGGQAFPSTYENGITVRDYFAAQALSTDWIADYSITEGAAIACKYADAMIAERSKGGAS